MSKFTKWQEALNVLSQKIENIWGGELIEKHDGREMLRIYCNCKSAVKQIPEKLAGYLTEPIFIPEEYILGEKNEQSTPT